jgi:hypothetical protein
MQMPTRFAAHCKALPVEDFAEYVFHIICNVLSTGVVYLAYCLPSNHCARMHMPGHVVHTTCCLLQSCCSAQQSQQLTSRHTAVLYFNSAAQLTSSQQQ